MAEFISLYSGSSGNCSLVRWEEKYLLIDMGKSCRTTVTALKQLGLNISDCQGILVTHEHSDHVKGIKMVCKKSDKAYIYANNATWEQIADEKLEDRHRTFNSGEMFTIKDIEIMPFRIHHDAVEPVGYSISYQGRKLSIVTDTGHISDDIFEEIKDSNLIVLESNHEINVLKMCKYPYQIKMRILGDHGHLSNTAAADCLVRILKEPFDEKRRVLLAHLSRENNTPGMARLAVRNALEANGLLSAEKVSFEVITQDEQSPLYTV